MVQVYPTIAEKSGNLGEIRFSAIDTILAGIVFEGATSNDKSGIWNDFMTSLRLLSFEALE